MLCGIDNRALTKVLRSQGVTLGSIATEPVSKLLPLDERLVEQISITSPQTYGQGDKTIITVDCGMKENILRCLQRFPWRVKCTPYDYDYTRFAKTHFRDLFRRTVDGFGNRCKNL